VENGDPTKTHRDQSSPSSVRASRRRLLKTGALLVPVVMTLRATPAWAQTDYTMTAYRYGTNQGLCKNPAFSPNAVDQPNSGVMVEKKQEEFISCPSDDDVVL
jgi:hypothetical protein